MTRARRSLTDPPRWLFENGPDVTHAQVIDDDCFDRAVASLAAHEVYLSVLDPDTPVLEQAYKQVDMATTPRPEFGVRTVEFHRGNVMEKLGASNLGELTALAELRGWKI